MFKSISCMKLLSILFSFILIFSACTKPSEHKDHGQKEKASDNPNEALYNQVMDIHDEAMPKMEDLYNLKRDLQEKIANTPKITKEQKENLERRIKHLDSTGKLMLEWMHKFDPLPDSADQEAAREYLENEMERIRKVKEAMLEAIEKESKKKD
jgi:hypothetical protein